MRLACAMLVGPGEADRHLERCIRHARSWADALIVYADGPDIPTLGLIGTYADYSHVAGQPVYEHAEHLARNRLFELADDCLDPGDIVAVLDADEHFHATPQQVRATLHAAAATFNDESWCVHFLHLWNPEGTMHRVDGAWQPSIGPRIYRHWPGQRVEPYPAAWVCPPLPRQHMRAGSPLLDVLHWSYARPQDRAPKHERYTRLTGHSSTHVDSILTEPTLEPVP